LSPRNKGLDDPTLPELGENGPETRFFDLGRFFGDLRRHNLLAFWDSRYPFSSQELDASIVAWTIA